MSDPNPVIVQVHETMLKEIRKALRKGATPVAAGTVVDFLEAFILHFPEHRAILEIKLGYADYADIIAIYNRWNTHRAAHSLDPEQQQKILLEMEAIVHAKLQIFRGEQTASSTPSGELPAELPDGMIVKSWQLPSRTLSEDMEETEVAEVRCSDLPGYASLPKLAKPQLQDLTVRELISTSPEETWQDDFLRTPNVSGKFLKPVYWMLVRHGCIPTLEDRKQSKLRKRSKS